MRVLSLLCATFLLFCAAPGEAAGVSATETPEGVCLRNERLVLTLGKDTKGAIRSLRDVATDTEFIATPASAALFGLAFSTAGQPTAPLTRVSGAEAARFAVACEATGKGQTVVLTYENLRQTGVNVVCRASAAPGDPLIRWRLSTTFPATLVLEEATFPIDRHRPVLHQRLLASGDRGVPRGACQDCEEPAARFAHPAAERNVHDG